MDARHAVLALLLLTPWPGLIHDCYITGLVARLS